MYVWVELESHLTYSFGKYLFDEIIKHAPLYRGKIVEVPVVENTDAFPEISKISHGGNEKNPFSSYEIDPSVYLTLVANKHGKNTYQELDNKGSLSFLKYQALSKYIRLTFPEMLEVVDIDLRRLSPLDLVYSFRITDGRKFSQRAEQLRVKTSDEIARTHNFKTSTPDFIEEPPQIVWDGVVIPIPPNSIQLCACRVAFNRKKGTIISWDEVEGEVEGVQKKELTRGWHSIYDAVRAINKRVSDATKLKLFKVSKLSFYRIF